MRALAAGGHLRALQALHARGWAVDREGVADAAREGHAHVVAWAVEALGEEVLTEELYGSATCSDSLQLLAWLRGRGCNGSDVWESAATAGCEEVMEWLDANDWPLSAEDDYVHRAVMRRAACAGDLATLACLRRLGCVWAEDGSTVMSVGCVWAEDGSTFRSVGCVWAEDGRAFRSVGCVWAEDARAFRSVGCVWAEDGRAFRSALHYRGQLPALRWLVEQGCPVDWGVVLGERACMGAHVRAWAEEEAAARGVRTAEVESH